MVVANMDGPSRDEALLFMQEKERIEQELMRLNMVLETNNVGMDDPLVDADGYPRSDVNVYQVRNARHRIICLKNDLKAIMDQIEHSIHALHGHGSGSANAGQNSGQPSAAGRLPDGRQMQPAHERPQANQANGQPQVNGHAVEMGVASRSLPRPSGSRSNPQNTSNTSMKPIVKVNLVSEGSPAGTAGIMLDDEIVQFGYIDSGNFQSVMQIGELVRHAIGTPVNVKLVRGGPASRLMDVVLVPQTWSGRGLLGCNIVPI